MYGQKNKQLLVFFFFFCGPVDSAREALTDMPPRWEEELDSVTLHNQALCSMDMSPTQGFHKLQFLMQQSAYPRETLRNLLVLYCKHGYHDLASDVISTYSPVKDKYLSNVRNLIRDKTTPVHALLLFNPHEFTYPL